MLRVDEAEADERLAAARLGELLDLVLRLRVGRKDDKAAPLRLDVPPELAEDVVVQERWRDDHRNLNFVVTSHVVFAEGSPANHAAAPRAPSEK